MTTQSSNSHLPLNLWFVVRGNIHDDGYADNKPGNVFCVKVALERHWWRESGVLYNPTQTFTVYNYGHNISFLLGVIESQYRDQNNIWFRVLSGFFYFLSVTKYHWESGYLTTVFAAGDNWGLFIQSAVCNKTLSKCICLIFDKNIFSNNYVPYFIIA